MTLVGCSDQLLVVLEFSTACEAVKLLGRITCFLIRGSWGVSGADFREYCVRMMHVLEDIFVGHGGKEFDFG